MVRPFSSPLLAAALLASPLALPAQADPANSFTVMSWNLEHFVDPFDDPYVENEKEDGPEVKPNEVLNLLATAIKEVDPAVIALQEVEGDKAVKLFLDSYLPGNEYKHYASVPAAEWYQNVVVVSKFPLGAITSLREVEMTSKITGEVRKNINNRLMLVEVRPSEEYNFLLGCLHLKAGGEEVDSEWRTLQIGLIHEQMERALKVEPQKNIIILGDMNYTPGSPEYLTMTTGGPVPLVDVFAEFGNPLTHPSDGPTRHIDMIYVNDYMMREYVPESAAIPQPIPAAQLSRITDHLPVVASFTIGDK